MLAFEYKEKDFKAMPLVKDKAPPFLDRAKKIFCNEPKLKNSIIILFGSFARGDWVPSSDFDVAVDTPQSLTPELRNYLESLWDKSNIPHRLDLIDLSKTDEKFKKAILKEGIVWNDPSV
jgi:predicted nucleotidyltransferase